MLLVQCTAPKFLIRLPSLGHPGNYETLTHDRLTALGQNFYLVDLKNSKMHLFGYREYQCSTISDQRLNKNRNNMILEPRAHVLARGSKCIIMIGKKAFATANIKSFIKPNMGSHVMMMLTCYIVWV